MRRFKKELVASLAGVGRQSERACLVSLPPGALPVPPECLAVIFRLKTWLHERTWRQVVKTLFELSANRKRSYPAC